MKRIRLLLTPLFLLLCVCSMLMARASDFSMPIGYSVNIQAISKEKMQHAKSLGIDYIELSNIGSMIDKDLNLKYDEDYWQTKVDSLKAIIDSEHMKVWSIHMPFSKKIDLSLLKEEERQKVVHVQLQLARILSRFQPNILLFHPSYYLELNKREQRIQQLVRSVTELEHAISKWNMLMVVENMLGPELRKGDLERPLLRTLEECVSVFAQFPDNVGLAVDMCHIMNAELLIQRFGSRVKTLHVSDGDGLAETHYLPCNALGKNNWNLIFEALHQINYKGVFMYECKYTDEKELKDCYDSLEKNYASYQLKNKRI